MSHHLDQPIGSWARTRDGRPLYTQHLGAGSPTVVFEAGMGMSRNMWGAVVGPVAARTSVVVYDRSGLGRSPRDHERRGLERLTADLLDLLGQLGDGPFVLVGHSWGGPLVRRAAEARPRAVAGLVLVDQTDERCDLFFTTANELRSRAVARLMPTIARLGLGRSIARKLSRDLPEPWTDWMRQEDGTVEALRTQGAEMAASVADLRELRRHPPVLPDVPLTVVSGTRITRLEGRQRIPLIDAHRAGADAHPQGRHVRADDSSHLVPFTEPQVVVDEVLRIVELTRS
ncbi:MAG: alpha/beta fold hydrolase [Microthrixaceae bacterium]